jgi:hypothetical protein
MAGKDDKNDKDGKDGKSSKDGKDDKADQDSKKDDGSDQDDDDSGTGLKFSQEQQAEIERLVAAERRKGEQKHRQLKSELDALKNKDLPEAQRTKAERDQFESELKIYKAKDAAAGIADDLKIPKAEQSKYLKYITATEPAEIKEQLKQLRKDFGAQQVGSGSNPPKNGKESPNDSINQFIRRKAGRE